MTRLLPVVFALLTATPALAESYACTVQDFTTFSRDDTGFIEANKRKTYDLTIDGDTITLAMHSQDFESNTYSYTVTRRAFLDTIARRADSSGVNLLVLPPRPAATLARDGHFSATLSVQSNHYTNSWLLACKAP
ncbi:hypothetical protein FHY55_07110 [Oceanicola sp. D3]|uniref:hypothetical protein n=1 Tax=Oceanicola sp. D3 TaxID=2587163 RepID=UPI0011219D8B|nr:hypothetical protein [Oceanicola sp. D3]QDC09027.1 hypothetical protein FHY55_07110 [Oceanicola sp. D3]